MRLFTAEERSKRSNAEGLELKYEITLRAFVLLHYSAVSKGCKNYLLESVNLISIFSGSAAMSR